jgi:S-adenosyl methyltransferase
VSKDAALSGDDGSEDLMARADTSVPVSARIWNYNESGAIPYRLRQPDQVARFFDGLELADPGLVPIHRWRPDPGTVNPPVVPAVGGIGRKP